MQTNDGQELDGRPLPALDLHTLPRFDTKKKCDQKDQTKEVEELTNKEVSRKDVEENEAEGRGVRTKKRDGINTFLSWMDLFSIDFVIRALSSDVNSPLAFL